MTATITKTSPAANTKGLNHKSGVRLRTRLYFAVGIAVILWSGLGAPTARVQLKSISIPTWTVTAIATVLSVIVIAIDVAPGTHMKDVLVFWRRRDPLPGSRAFEKSSLKRDTRIDQAALRKAVGGKFPRAAADQNALWYKLFKSLDDDHVVQAMYFDFLLFRDLAWLSIVLALFVLLNLFLDPPLPRLLWFEVGAFSLLYLLFGRAAAERGHRLVNQVLATVSVYPAKAKRYLRGHKG